MLVKICGLVRGLVSGNYPDADEDKQMIINNRGDLLVAQSLPPLAELIRLGNSWQVASTTGQAALTALPTTTSGLTIKNGEAATGKCYIIDSFGSWEAVVDATQTDVTAIFAMLNARNDVAASGGTVETGVKSLSGRQPAQSAIIATRGMTVTNNGWFPHGIVGGGQMAAAAAGANWKVNEVQVNGLYIVPPGGFFSIQAVKAAAAAAAQQFFFIRYHEVQLIYVP